MDDFDLVKAEFLQQLCIDHGASASRCIQRVTTPEGYTKTEFNDKNELKYMENGTQQLLSQNGYEKNNNSNEMCKNSSKGNTLGSCNHTLEKKNLKNRSDDEEYAKYRNLLSYEDAPKHLQFNPFIRGGYRTILCTKHCLESVFWWTNETINIWSHIFGWFLFIGLTINDIHFLSMHAALQDKIIVGTLLVCFQLCMILSSLYHTFSCRSEKVYECFLAYDLFGIALSLLAIYVSGIYYAFWCHETLRNFYAITVAAIFIIAMVIQIPSLRVDPNIKIAVFVAWAAYGVVPTIHWTLEMGGFQNTMVKLLLPRVIGMYLITGTAFLFYITRIPERWFVGKVDFIGHSHNWWHFFVLVALYYWHNTGIMYLDYRVNHGCTSSMIVE